MRNMRSALLALGVAGAAYVWRNRQQLQQQFGSRGWRSSPRQLPDYSSGESHEWSEPNSELNSSRERQFGGSDI